MKKVLKILIAILILGGIIAGIIIYMMSNKFEYNDDNAVGNTAGNLYNGGNFCEYGDYIYFANPNDYNQLYRMDLEGKNRELVFADKASYINVCNDYIYYVRNNHSKNTEMVLRGSLFGIYRLEIGSKDVTELHDGIVDSLALCGNKLYFRSYNDTELITVRSIMIDGESEKEVTDSDITPVSVYNGNMYYANVDRNHDIMLLNAADDSTTDIKVGNYYMPVVEENILYYIDVDNNYKLVKEDFSTGETVVLTDDKCINYNVSTKYGVIFYQVENHVEDHRLMRMDLDGENEEMVEIGDCTKINITKNYTYYHKIVGGEYKTYFVETTGSVFPQKFE